MVLAATSLPIPLSKDTSFYVDFLTKLCENSVSSASVSDFLGSGGTNVFVFLQETVEGFVS